jgi:hypothetical protein
VVVEQAELKGKAGGKSATKRLLLSKGETTTLRHADALCLVPQDDTTRFVVHVPPSNTPHTTASSTSTAAGSSQESSQVPSTPL